jgi:hypothetical protein
MKLLEIFSNISFGSPDAASDSTSMDDAQLLRNVVRKRKKDMKWITRRLSSKSNVADDDKPDFAGDGDGDESDQSVDAGWRYDGG